MPFWWRYNTAFGAKYNVTSQLYKMETVINNSHNTEQNYLEFSITDNHEAPEASSWCE